MKSTTLICKQCQTEVPRETNRQIYCKQKECLAARQRVRWERWRDKQERNVYRDKANEYQRAFRERTGYGRDWELKKKYGITLEEWLKMVHDADGKCEICGKDDERMCVDHDHITGAVRGVLCSACNRAIGQLGDSYEHLIKAVAYLERTRLEE